jgi:predicted enzyme related to lactoylglutathione lyase
MSETLYVKSDAGVMLGGMHGEIAHVAVNTADIPTTRAFYEALFGWSFTEYAPSFLRAELPGGGIAALQGRRSLLPDGAPTTGLEVTFQCDDADALAAVVEANGGTILMAPTEIAGVGRVTFFRDPGGNVAGAIHFFEAAI